MIPDYVDNILSIEKMTPEMLFMIKQKYGYQNILSMSLQFVKKTHMPYEDFDDKLFSFIDEVDEKIRYVSQPNISSLKPRLNGDSSHIQHQPLPSTIRRSKITLASLKSFTSSLSLSIDEEVGGQSQKSDWEISENYWNRMIPNSGFVINTNSSHCPRFFEK
jgi:hypothetical protein